MTPSEKEQMRDEINILDEICALYPREFNIPEKLVSWGKSVVERTVRAERKRTLESEVVKNIVDAARGLSFGTDWNNGTHAKLHRYRQELLDALRDYDAKATEMEG